MSVKKLILVLVICLCSLQVSAGGARFTQWSGRRLLAAFSSLRGQCLQGPQQENTQETMLNGHDWWENNWGRSDDAWPRRGWSECWENRGDVCALPDQDHVVCLPGSRRGSTVNKGWALDPKSQACQPGVHCLYACEPGYYWTQFNQGETSNYDFANGAQRGNCDGTWDYGTSTHGIYCKEDGTLDMPKEPLCKLGETYVYAENQLDTHIFLCQTVFPGHEIFLIPTMVKPGESVMITTQPMEYWHGPTYAKPTHGDFYVSFAGADIMEACTWDGFSPSGAALLPYEIGSGVEDNGVVYSTHYFYQQPNSEVPAGGVGYIMDLTCESSEDGVCGPVFRNAGVVKADVLRRPQKEGSTKVKFVFKKPHMENRFGEMYNDPNKPNMPDPMMITGIANNMGGHGQHNYHSDGHGDGHHEPNPMVHTATPHEETSEEVAVHKEEPMYVSIGVPSEETSEEISVYKEEPMYVPNGVPKQTEDSDLDLGGVSIPDGEGHQFFESTTEGKGASDVESTSTEEFEVPAVFSGATEGTPKSFENIHQGGGSVLGSGETSPEHDEPMAVVETPEHNGGADGEGTGFDFTSGVQLDANHNPSSYEGESSHHGGGYL